MQNPVTQKLLHELTIEKNRIALDAVAPSLITDSKAEVKQAFYIAQSELLIDILERNLLESLIVDEEESNEA